MTGDYLLNTLLESFESSYDVERTCDINGDIYEAYARFCAQSSKYVLVKKAQLWRAECFEHVFFREKDLLTREDIEKFHRQIIDYIEPQLVRGGKPCPQKDHMYTFMTGIFICEDGVSPEAERAVKKFKFFKNYRFSIRGYSEARILVFDLKNERIFGNPAAKQLVKGYKGSGILK